MTLMITSESYKVCKSDYNINTIHAAECEENAVYLALVFRDDKMCILISYDKTTPPSTNQIFASLIAEVLWDVIDHL